MQEKYAVNSRKFKYDVTANGKINFSPSVFSRLYTYVYAFTVNKGFFGNLFFYCGKGQQKQSSYLPFAVAVNVIDSLFFYKNVVFLSQAEHFYFSAEFRLKIFLYYS